MFDIYITNAGCLETLDSDTNINNVVVLIKTLLQMYAYVLGN